MASDRNSIVEAADKSGAWMRSDMGLGPYFGVYATAVFTSVFSLHNGFERVQGAFQRVVGVARPHSNISARL